MSVNGSAPSPLSELELVDEYFIENRTRLLDLAAFLDRLDRARVEPRGTDFRMRAFERALQVLARARADRVEQIQLIFSDPTVEPRPALDRKSASGAHEPWPAEGR
jgi:hypothetical protein